MPLAPYIGRRAANGSGFVAGTVRR